jgi:opacity protein-like surface antigen
LQKSKLAIRVRVLPFCKEDGHMSSLLKKRLLSLLLLLLGSVLADQAAAQNYEGPVLLRFGAFGQGTWDSFKVTDSTPASGTAHGDGAAGGIAFGIDYRLANGVLIGVESDLSIGALGGDFDRENFGVDLWWTVRGRLGLHARPDLLIYATGGAAFASVESLDRLAILSAKSTDTLPGWTAGGGLEYDLFHSTTLFGEYLFMSFGDWDFQRGGVGTGALASSAGLGAATPRTFHSHLDTLVFRLGVKFKVGYDGYDP